METYTHTILMAIFQVNLLSYLSWISSQDGWNPLYPHGILGSAPSIYIYINLYPKRFWSICYRLDVLPVTQPTLSQYWRHQCQPVLLFHWCLQMLRKNFFICSVL